MAETTVVVEQVPDEVAQAPEVPMVQIDRISLAILGAGLARALETHRLANQHTVEVVATALGNALTVLGVTDEEALACETWMEMHGLFERLGAKG